MAETRAGRGCTICACIYWVAAVGRVEETVHRTLRSTERWKEGDRTSRIALDLFCGQDGDAPVAVSSSGMIMLALMNCA